MNNCCKTIRVLGKFCLSMLAISFILLPVAHGQEPTITPNYKDADLRQIVEAVGEVTGKNFLLDPRVDAKVTMLSSTPMSPDAFYEAFLSILEVHGFVAIPSDDLIKILPNASARQYPAYSSTSGAGGDDLVTQVIQVKNVGAAQLVPILRPLIPQYGHLAAHPGSNMLIISDRAANVMRMLSIIRRIDQSNDEDIEVVPLSHASAAEIVRVLTTLTQTPRTDGMPVTTSLVADPRTNSVLIGGDRSERLRLRALIAHLDTPLEDGGDTQVRYLRYADAEELSTKLQQHFTAQLSAQGQGGQAAAGAQQISVWSDPQTNALIINAPPKMMRSLMQIVDKLDIRRAQVLVEAIIVEVTADKASELGVTWAVDGSGSNSVVGVTRFTGAGTNVVDLAGLVGTGTGADPTGLISDGITTAVGRISERGTSFAAILNALEGDADTNIISTPTLVTTDNEEASIKVGQEVPFVTGSFSSTGSNTGGVNPFQTIQREQVGVKLTITPQINEGDAILLQISQEISSIAESATAGAADLITNERTIDTTVIVEDGGILVLGGLIEDTLRENTQRVPILGRIPIMGALFRNRSVQKVKTNLMVFIRPKILRDASQTAIETGAKYNYIRDMQRSDRVPQLRGVERPVIPPLDAVGGYEDDDGEKNYDGN
ncbi:MAG: type II secretion system secretin GspD [Woeseia sp.]|nr:type II secretion system secretin GspD [Woeseia sp.]